MASAGRTGAAQDAFPSAVQVKVADVAGGASFGEGEAKLLHQGMVISMSDRNTRLSSMAGAVLVMGRRWPVAGS